MRFEEFARLHGLVLDIAYPSEKIRRCGTEAHPRSDNGSYMFDGRRGWVKLWDGDGETHWWNDPDAKPWTAEEKRAWAFKQQAKRRAEREGWLRAAARARQIVSECTVGPHLYLQSKALREATALVHGENDELIVPMRTFDDNQIVGVQRIYWEPEFVDEDGEVVRAHWAKKMLYQMNPRGAVFRIGPARVTETWLVEGYATGLSVEAALRQLHVKAAVLVCFSDHNMAAVAAKVPGRKFTFADHDKSGAGQRAAEKIGAPVAMSPVLGEDANDVHQRAGLVEVCRLVMEARRP